MVHDSFVISTYVQLLREYLHQSKLVPAQLLSAEQLALLDAAAAQAGQGRFSRQALSAILRQVQQQIQHPALGLDIARNITAAHLGVLGYLILACSSLGEALVRLDRYGRLIDDALEMNIRQTDQFIELSWPVLPPHEAVFVELGVAVVVQFARNVTGQDAPMSAVGFAHTQMGAMPTYRQFFGGSVAFGQEFTFLRFPIAYLALPLRQPDGVLLGILEAQANQAMSLLPRTDVFLQEVRGLLVRLCREGAPTLEQVAQVLCMTPRTLQRRLAEHGVRFQPLLDEIRWQLCEQYLQDERLQLADIALLLGYSDQSALTRAYRRWTGKTPHQQRRQGDRR
ncbi:MAG: AraC family transcriptional regulator ligand-binding domain-containing protein [Pseudomonadota bacterium]|nr:AraC family transcriptional regulator ligand-binding domain-containing protein [Pseudomonadota bacterium]